MQPFLIQSLKTDQTLVVAAAALAYIGDEMGGMALIDALNASVDEREQMTLLGAFDSFADDETVGPAMVEPLLRLLTTSDPVMPEARPRPVTD